VKSGKKVEKIGGQNTNSELYPPLIGDPFPIDLFSMPHYICLRQPKILTLRFKDQAVSRRLLNARALFENLIFEDVTICDILSISARDI